MRLYGFITRRNKNLWSDFLKYSRKGLLDNSKPTNLYDAFYVDYKFYMPRFMCEIIVFMVQIF